MSSETDVREWHYCDVLGGAQKGPVPAVVLCRLLEKGVGVSPQTLIWKAGMETWLPMAAVEPFKSIAEFNSMQWYYIDIEGQQHGPVLSKMIVHKLKEGDLDGLSLVYGGDSTTEWRKVSEVEVLKKELAKIATEEENMRLAFLKAEDDKDIQQQVFVEDFDPSTAFPIPKEMLARSAAIAATAASAEEDASADPKVYIADNGQRYVWDDEEQDWVEDETGEEANDHTASGAALAKTADSQKKRKVDKVTANTNPDDDSGDEGEEHDTDGNNKTDVSNGSSTDNKLKKKRAKKKSKKGPNTWVYITGLPPDVTAQEIKEHFSKVGLIALSPYDQQAKIKIYRDASLAPVTATSATSSTSSEAPCKGDALVCYNAEESVKLAVDVLSGGFLRPTHQVTVTRADFTSDTNHNNNNGNGGGGGSTGENKPHQYKPSLSQAQVKVAKSAIKQALTWNEDDDIGVSRAAALRIIVIEGLFKPSDFLDPTFSDELEGDIASECEKCGAIEKITFFSSNPRGIAVVKFATSFAAQECIRLMNGRFFAGKKLKSFFWDGVANYDVTGQSEAAQEEAEKQEENRLDEFGDWLENNDEELPEEFRLRTE